MPWIWWQYSRPKLGPTSASAVDNLGHVQWTLALGWLFFA
jgi:hypothetical protein